MGDVRRERDVTDAIECGEEILDALKDRLKADAALAELGAGEDLGFKFVPIVLAEEQAFTNADLAAGPNQAFPVVGLGGELTRQQNLDAAVEEVARRRIVRADRLGAGAFAAAVEPRWKNAGVVEDHEVTGPQQLREVAEQAVGMLAADSPQVQHAGGVADGEGFLGDQFVGQVEVEVGNQHGVRL